ncbi:MAG: L-threonine 3-dehydrogenase [Defluviitaleaceae bacterium]|nr:L-threonine 3-dehydrogenase [Defluviitaleaceae bacterium]
MATVSSNTMKAIIKQTPEPGGLIIADVPMPKIGVKDVLVKIKKTAICGTDIHIYNWDEWAQRTIKTPQIIGHEFVGEVVEAGEGVTNIKPGNLVSGEGHLVCGVCRHCITGNLHLCRQTVGIGVNIDGVFSEYISIPASNAWVCNPAVSEDVLSVQDPLGNAVHTALSFNLIGEDVLITGAGPIGLMSVPIVKRAGARHIVVTDINPKRLEMAKDLGATATVDVTKQNISDAIKFLNMNEGFDVGLEMSGSPAAFNDMINAMANGGKIAILGIISNSTQVDWDKIIFNSLTLKGIYGREMYSTWYKMSMLLQSGLDKEVAKIITHSFPFQDFQEAFEIMKSGESGKVILDWV